MQKEVGRSTAVGKTAWKSFEKVKELAVLTHAELFRLPSAGCESDLRQLPVDTNFAWILLRRASPETSSVQHRRWPSA